MSRSERLQRARVFDSFALGRGLTNGQIARWLDVGESYVRKLRRGDRSLNAEHIATLQARGLELTSLGAVGTELLSSSKS